MGSQLITGNTHGYDHHKSAFASKNKLSGLRIN